MRVITLFFKLPIDLSCGPTAFDRDVPYVRWRGPETRGTGSPRANGSFFSVAFSSCRRAISVSSAERSSGTTLQVPPASLRLHCETWPVRSPQPAVGHSIEAVAAVFAIGQHRLRRRGREVRNRPREGNFAFSDMAWTEYNVWGPGDGHEASGV